MSYSHLYLQSSKQSDEAVKLLEEDPNGHFEAKFLSLLYDEADYQLDAVPVCWNLERCLADIALLQHRINNINVLLAIILKHY